VKEAGGDHEIILSFNHNQGIHIVKSAVPIPHCAKFRYFEIEVLENKADAAVFFGIIEQKENFNHSIDAIEHLDGS
jgi:hypothetical protein